MTFRLRPCLLTAASCVVLSACVQISTISAETEPVAPQVEEQMAIAPASDTQGVERIEVGNLVMENIPEIPQNVRDRLRSYQNVRANTFAGWVGDEVLIGTRFAEVSQVHRVKKPEGARHQITFYEEPVGGTLVSPDGGSFLFTKDTGGDEFNQGYLFDLATGDVTAFTEPGTRNGAMNWSGDGSLVVWYESRRGKTGWDILAGDPRDPHSVRVIYEGESGFVPIDVDETGSSVLVQQYISIQKSRLFILDVASGEMTELNPDLNAAYQGGSFLPDGAILTSTDEGSEFINLVRLDPETGAMTSYTDSINWGVQGFDLSPDGQTVVFGVNEGGLGTLKLLDLETGEVRSGPDLPVGIASSPVFNADGTSIAFNFSSATSPADVWSFDVETLAVTRWTTAEVGGLNTAAFTDAELFEYPNADGMDIPAFIYRPEGEGPHPVIISIHGGPEGQSRPWFSGTYQYWANELGAAVVVPNVRGSTGYGKTYVSLDNGLNRKRSVEDIGSLLDWIDGQSDLDSERVVVYGGSYGGYMVLASMIDYADRIAAGINVVGVSDFKTFLKNTQDYRRDLRRAEYGDERDPEISAFFDEISPLRNAHKITKPIFIIQGYNDPRVPYTEAEQILSAVRENGGDAWYLMAMDEGHGFRKKSNRDFMSESMTLFLKDVLSEDADAQ